MTIKGTGGLGPECPTRLAAAAFAAGSSCSAIDAASASAAVLDGGFWYWLDSTLALPRHRRAGGVSSFFDQDGKL
jgi:hypothetical protein